MSSTVHTEVSLRGCRVLLAEDVELNRFLVKEMVRRHELKLDIVPNGAEAVKATLAAGYDLILMDIHMPEMDGMEATKMIRSDPANPNRAIPIIALSASMFENEQAGFIEAGMNAVLEKPFSAERLADVMLSFMTQTSAALNESQDVHVPGNPEPFSINMDYLLQIGKNNREFAGMMLYSFRDSVAELIVDLERSATEGDRQLTAQVLHKLKFAINVMGAGNLDQELKWIETEARNKVSSNEREYQVRLSAFIETIHQLYNDANRLIQSGEWG